ncbi:MAG: dienelactone hydrolase family protein [Hyphomicrobiales bacterium]|nr:dienelactone hydrolase family protein [Hyphomicrobiales bacterium]
MTSSASAIDGPRLAPASGGAARQLVVLCHGYGADGSDLIGLGREWAGLLPDAAFVAPNAPEPCAISAFGRQWFGLSFRDPAEYWRGVREAGPGLDAFLDAELARHGLAGDALGLVGFSQGTMMALHVGLRREVGPAVVVGYSGALAGPEHLPGERKARPPILLVHGDRDDVIPVEALSHAREGLAAAGLAVEWHVSEGVGHGIDPEGLRLGGQFLSRALSGPSSGDR